MSGEYRCLALVTDAFGGRGGIARYNCDFLSALAQSGLVTSIDVLPRHAPDPVVLPARIIAQAPSRGRFRFVVEALGMAMSGPVDAVFCGHLHIAPLAAFIAWLKRAKLIVQFHGVEAWAPPSWPWRAAVNAADLVLCVSRHTRSAVLAWAKIAPERVAVLFNTVDAAFAPGDGSALRRSLGLENKYVLLTVGRLDLRERYKGHDRVIAAIPALVAKGHDIAYLIVGEGDDISRLQACARGAGVSDRVRFLGATTLETLVDAYRMADLFVMPSKGEGFGIVFLEAMACGTPALGLAVGGARDALGDGELGIAVGEAEFAEALVRAVDAPKPDPEIFSHAVQTRFGHDRFNKNVAALLAPVLRSQ